MPTEKSGLQRPGIALSVSIILMGLALGLPQIHFGKFGLDFGEMPPTVITVLRIGIIGLALTIGMIPLEEK